MKRAAFTTGVVLLVITLSSVVAYRLGLRRGAVRPAIPTASEAVEGPCVDFSEAGPLVGKSACVTGRVLRVYTSRAGNTFLDFCPDYRQCPFASVVFSEDRAKFGDLHELRGRRVELRGLVSFYQERAEIIIREPHQLQVVP